MQITVPPVAKPSCVGEPRYSHCDWDHFQIQQGYTSQAITGKDSGGPPPGSAAPVYAMPYEKDSAKGVLLVNKKAVAVDVTIAGATDGSATSVEVNTDPSCSDPGFEPQVQKAISAKGVLSLGPFAVAVVTELVEAE